MTGVRLGDLARDGLYVAVGTGVLAFQRIQVAQRDLERRVAELEERIDDALDSVSERLPGPARAVLSTVRETTRDGAAQLRALVGR